jgi:hypothetical protein
MGKLLTRKDRDDGPPARRHGLLRQLRKNSRSLKSMRDSRGILLIKLLEQRAPPRPRRTDRRFMRQRRPSRPLADSTRSKFRRRQITHIGVVRLPAPVISRR